MQLTTVRGARLLVLGVSLVAWLAAMHPNLSAQPQVTLPSSEVDYFQYVFMGLTDPSRTPEELQLRKEGYTRRLGLDASETLLLDGALVEFQQALGLLREQSGALLRTKQPGHGLTKSDDRALAPFLTAYQARIKVIGNAFVGAARKSTKDKIGLAIQRKPY